MVFISVSGWADSRLVVRLEGFKLPNTDMRYERLKEKRAEPEINISGD
jgi:hypothetical protein